MIRLALILLLIAPVVSGATTRPATTQSLEQALAQHKREQEQEYLDQLKPAPELKLSTGQITDIFEFSIEKDLLIVRPKLTGTNGQARCTVKGIVGPCSVAIFEDTHAPGGGINALQFAHRDFTNPQEIFRHTMLFAHAGSVQLSMDLDGLVRSKSVSMIEDMKPEDPDNAVRINVQVIDAVTDDVIGQYNVGAPSFRELRKRYPRETQEFVVPILRDLQSQTILAPDPRIASQALQTQFKPDEALSKKIDAALAKFDSDKFQEREQAAKDLADLGQPAAMALSHADRKGWSLDRQSGVDAFLSQYKAMSDEELAKLRQEPIFLLDCLYSDDASIRAAAAKMMEKQANVKIDPDASGEAREQMIDRAYARLFRPLPIQPTTKP
jgi:hypothetical protein